MTFNVETATDRQRDNYKSEIDIIDARRGVIDAQVAAYRDRDDLSDADRKEFKRLTELDDALRNQREVLDNALTKMNLGSPADEAKTRRDNEADVLRWAYNGPEALAGNTEQLTAGGDFIFDFDDVFAARLGAMGAAHNLPLIERDGFVNATVERPSAPGFEVGVMSSLIFNLKYFGAVRRTVDVMTTPDGNDLNQGTLDDTAEGDVVSPETTEAAISQNTGYQPVNVVYKRNLFRSKKAFLPFSVDRDAPYNFEQRLGRMLGRQIARAQENDFTTGSKAGSVIQGITEGGLVLRTGSGQTNAGARRISVDDGDDIIARLNAIRSQIDPAYRGPDGEGNPQGFMPQRGTIAWMFHNVTWETDMWVPLVQDTNYLSGVGQTAITEPGVDRVLGYPVRYNNFFKEATVSGDDRTFAINQFIGVLIVGAYYTIRDIGRIRLHRDPYGAAGDNAAVTLVAFHETDGRFNGAIISTGNTQAGKCEAATVYQAASA